MSIPSESRRRFLAQTAGAGAAVGLQLNSSASAKPAPTEPAIRKHNPAMGNRTLGKTGIRISEISLGGHGKPESVDVI